MLAGDPADRPKRARTERQLAADRRRSERMTRYNVKARGRAHVSRPALRSLPAGIRRGTGPESLRPFVEDMELETAGLIQALGGVGRISEQRLVLLGDAALVGVTL